MRFLKKTIFFVGEGKTEKAFLQFLWDKCGSFSSITPTIKNAFGGSPAEVVRYCIRKSENLAFDERFVLIDDDVGRSFDDELKQKMEESPKVKIILSKPCVEGLFLRILEDDEYEDGMATGACKHIFEKKYLNRHQKVSKYEYYRHFTDEIIERQKGNIDELKKILDIFQYRGMGE